MKTLPRSLILGCIILFCTQCGIKHSNLDSVNNLLVIKELIVEPNTIVKVRRSKLIVYIRYYDSRLKLKGKKVYTKKLEANELDEIKVRVHNLFELDEAYSKGMLGGILWVVNIDIESRTKTIIFDNTLHEAVVELFEYLNELVPGDYLFAVDSVPLYEE
jgi:hypothetical protein